MYLLPTYPKQNMSTANTEISLPGGRGEERNRI